MVDWYLQKMHAVLTNVPGPLNPISFAGQEIVSYKPIIPQPGPGWSIAVDAIQKQYTNNSYSDKVVWDLESSLMLER